MTLLIARSIVIHQHRLVIHEESDRLTIVFRRPDMPVVRQCHWGWYEVLSAMP